MKDLAINGSARKDGNTAILINAVFGELSKAGIETEMCSFPVKSLSPVRPVGPAVGEKTVCIKRIYFRKSLEK